MGSSDVDNSEQEMNTSRRPIRLVDGITSDFISILMILLLLDYEHSTSYVNERLFLNIGC